MRFLKEDLNTTSPSGKLIFHTVGAFAEFEVDTLKERTRAGILAARERGTHMGRRPTISADAWSEMKTLMLTGVSVPTLARLRDVQRQAIYYGLDQEVSGADPRRLFASPCRALKPRRVGQKEA